MGWKKMGQSLLDLSIESGKEFVNKMDKKTQSIERISEKKAKEQGVSLSDRFYKKMDDMYDTIDDAYDSLDIMEEKYHSSFKNTTDGYEVDDYEYVDDIEDEEVKHSSNNHNYEEHQEEIIIKPITIDNYEENLQKAICLFLEYKLDEAFVIFKSLAENGIGRAMYFVGQYYEEAYGSIRKNETLAKNWYLAGQEAGDILCDLKVNWTKDEEILIEIYKKIYALAQKGDMFAQHELAFMYEWGCGICENIEKSMKWTIKSAEQGNWLSVLKILYYAGEDDNYLIFLDEWETLLKCYMRMAEMGIPQFQYELSSAYNNRSFYKYLKTGLEDDEMDIKESTKWLQKAADGMYPDALYCLGGRYYSGKKDVEQDYEKALYYYKKAAELGCVTGISRKEMEDCIEKIKN